MAQALRIDPSWHPLIDGCPPELATEWAEDAHGVYIAFTLDDVTQRLRWIPAGAFRMGSPGDEPGRYDDEDPQHIVSIPRGFWLFDTPCTQALWAAVMGRNPSRFKRLDRPVEQVSWDDVQAFLERINARIPGLDLVLPSEAQWEHACRAGTETALYTGAIEILGERNAPALDAIAWYGGNSGEGFELEDGYDSSGWSETQYSSKKSGAHPVGQKEPNAWGLYDMLGNVEEWVQDHWHDSYEGAPTDGSAWLDSDASSDAHRVIRGGSWYDDARDCRSASRSSWRPDYRGGALGFRPARAQVS